MPRKLLTDGFRGWHGREGHTNSVLRMSNTTVWDCRHKMDQERHRHELAMEHLQAMQRWEQKHSRKAYNSLQEEFSRIRAERTVLRTYAFHTYDPSRAAEPPASRPSAKTSPQKKRKPKTERTSVYAFGATSQMVKRNSLPNIDQPENMPTKTTKKTPKEKRTSSKDGFDSWNSADVVTLVETEEKKKASRRRKLMGASRGALFMTDSELITSTVVEEDEDEEEGDDDVFYEADDRLPVLPSSKDDDPSGETVHVSLHELQPDGSLSRQGKSPDANGFQNIDYILGARRRPPVGSGALTSTPSAKPPTPKATVKPSHRTPSADVGPFEKQLQDSVQRTITSPAAHADIARTVSTHTVAEGPSTSTDRVPHVARQDQGLTPSRTIHEPTQADKVLHVVGQDQDPTLSRSIYEPTQADNVSHVVRQHDDLTPSGTIPKPTQTDKVLDVVRQDQDPTLSRNIYDPTQADSVSHVVRQDDDLTPSGTIREPTQADKTPHVVRQDQGPILSRTNNELTQADKVSSTLPQAECLQNDDSTQAECLQNDDSTQAECLQNDDSTQAECLQNDDSTQAECLQNDDSTQAELIPPVTKEDEAAALSCPAPQSRSDSRIPQATDAASNLVSISKASQPLRAFGLPSSKSSPSQPEKSTNIPAAGGDQSDPAASPSKPSLLSRFRQAAEVIVEEKRCERETNMSMFSALLLNKPQRELRMRPVEKPIGVQKEERRTLWQELLMNVQSAVRWKAKVLRERQGILNTRQMRRKAREEQRARGRPRRQVFPGRCKTTFAMKKFLSKEVDDLVESWRPENLRRNRNRKLVERTTLPQFVDRVRSTTAILREFKQYQSKREGVGA